MKLFAILAITLGTLAAHAYPAVGDASTFNGKFYQAGSTQAIMFMQSLELTAYDKSKNEFTMKITLDLPNGDTKVEEQQVAAANLLDEAAVNNVLSVCNSQGGTIEKVSVDAGDFEACAIPLERGGKTWVAHAPFGVVKEVSIDEEGNKVVLELASFVLGK